MTKMTEVSDSYDRFSSISPAEFFYRNRQMAGFGNPTQAIYSTIRELVENSLDACEDAQTLPVIRVGIESGPSDQVIISVSDNGIGVPACHVPEAFGRILYGNKYSARQRRGTFGLGVSMAILYGQITTDLPVTIHTRTKDDSGHLYQILIDIEKNRPIVESEVMKQRDELGTTVRIQQSGDLARATDRVVEYLRLSTISTPHASMLLEIDGAEVLNLGPWTDMVPPLTTTVKPHPRSSDLELIRRLIQSHHHKRLREFLTESFQQVGRQTASRFFKFANIDPTRIISSLTRDEMVQLSSLLQKFNGFNRPDSICLSPIGSEPFTRAIQSNFDVSFIKYIQRKPVEWFGNPFIVEGVLAVSADFAKADT
ncbi:MAG: DNA topoisomerase VI subunit B, partial [Candidatus Thorarchaeota archaeon]